MRTHVLSIYGLTLWTLLFTVWLIQCPTSSSLAASTASGPSTPQKPWLEKLETRWGGHLKVRGSASWIEEDSVFEPVGTRTYYDGSAEGRVKMDTFFGDLARFNTHYKMVLSGGDTRRKTGELKEIFPYLSAFDVLLGRPVEDERRLMDLTKVISRNDSRILYHRLDRLSLTLLRDGASLCVGRQALTWGNGLLFNPMDLFNPFSPTDTERDYKIGDDMAHVQIPFLGVGNLQFLYVPRRDPATDSVDSDQSSLAGKIHFPVGTTEIDLMASRHYEDHVFGAGGTGYMGSAAWRIDLTWTSLDAESPSESYLSLVANVDYSWAWWKKNFYGFLELFYCGLGEDDYTQALANPDIIARLGRGELYTLGEVYLAGHVRVELHPLFNVFLTVINNLEDPSGILQPRATWDITQDIQLTLGGDIFYGNRNTEYGGFTIPSTGFTYRPSNNAYLRLTYYF